MTDDRSSKFTKGLRQFVSKNKHTFDTASIESETSEINNIFDTSIESRYSNHSTPSTISTPDSICMNRTYKKSIVYDKKAPTNNSNKNLSSSRTSDTAKDKTYNKVVKSKTTVDSSSKKSTKQLAKTVTTSKTKSIKRTKDDESDSEVGTDSDDIIEVEQESVISISPFKKSECEPCSEEDEPSVKVTKSRKTTKSTSTLNPSSKKNTRDTSSRQVSNIGSIDIIFGAKSGGSKDSEDTPYNSDNEDMDVKQKKEFYIAHMDNIVDQIKQIRWGETITVSADPNFVMTEESAYRMCAITKVVRYKSYVFYGNGSKNILRYFMNKTKNDQEYGFQKIVQILNEKGHRRFVPIRSWEQLWETYSDEPIKYRYLFELIRSDQPCKPYLDIEWVEEDKDPRKTNYSEFITKLKADLILIFKERYNIDISDTSIMISTSHSSKKVSFHVVIDKMIGRKTLAFRTNRKGCPESAWDLLIALIEHDPAYEDVLDGNVYTTDREFRVIYSNKTTEYRPLVPYGKRVKEEDNEMLVPLDAKSCFKHIVTYSANNEYYHIVTPEVPKKYLALNRNYDPNTFVPQTYTDKKINHLLELARKIHPTAEYTGMSGNGGWRFSYRDKLEACYSGNYHDSNGFYMFEDTEKGQIYMKCMSDQCRGRKILERQNAQPRVITKKLF
ncbi:putative helicase [Yasminevirus sp. GU-2018]|uniref:Putative helicase n=1 Tax=Yasminevirus sp. GU-2018 TaxID=2420051 RepID=A0A5K0U747_9VIRU|nr:putative helicase [Yasminevirus sp. GU-2018]